MKLKNMLAEMEYCGEILAPVRQYTVLRKKQHYILCSPKRGAVWEGDFVIVKAAAVEYLAKRLKGQNGLTSTMVRDRTRTAQFARERFDVLNGMYVLVALGRAKMDQRYKRRAIYFNVYR